MHPEITLPMVDGTRVVVPDSLDLITPYVLREQQDWFEDEIRFLRRLLQPGQNVIDIGANFGLYALSAARAVGTDGHVWAFEPASATAAYLAKSIEANDFEHVTLEQCALSSREGTARFSVHMHAEMNALVTDRQGFEPTENVRLVTLDGYLQELGGRSVDFVKIDAEGEEINIIEGGRRFFTEQSPLVQYELMEGMDVHLEITQSLAEAGYASYRLVPGLDLLVPFDGSEPKDKYQLNLFACKPDRAETLAADGWLLWDMPTLNPESDLPGGVTTEFLLEKGYDWRSTLAAFPYGRALAKLWERGVLDEETTPLEEALALYQLSQERSRHASQRFSALLCGLRRLQVLTEQTQSHSRMVSLARLARDFGARELALNALTQVANNITEHGRLNIAEPFLAPAGRFEQLDPGESIGDWFMTAVLEQMEYLYAFSSIYQGQKARNLLEQICASPFAGEEMKRRLALVKQKFDLT